METVGKAHRLPERLFVAVLLVLGLLARLLAARGNFLMFDEDWHLRIASASSLAGVYRSSLESAHPPVFMLLLHVWKGLARSPWQLRWLPVVFGVAFLYAAYRWARSVFGEAAALMTLALLSLLPSLVLLSAELRAYGLLLYFLAACLAALEQALRKESIGMLLLSTLWAALALLTHYAAFWVVLAAGAYGAARILSGRLSARFTRGWAASQAALASICFGLYVSHVSKLLGGDLERDAQARWLKESYFRAGVESPLEFFWRQTLSIFRYVFATPTAAVFALGLFLLALGWLAFRAGGPGGRCAALLLSLPFLLHLAAGLLGLYPYGGTRHTIDLALFLCAGVGLALAKLSGERRWAVVALSLILAPAGFAAVW